VILLIPWVNWIGFFAFAIWVIVASFFLWQATSRLEHA
jgi:hypothetical protein